ncbi:hypothetical protein A3863_04765 [Priestia endophytica]|uniref:hypothetical protein n=1 Tax=Priestia endophytica TaxID=135735 RepID=UPI000DCA9245|nr:hypothetical protein [Priestia endophytica]RAS91794.1 hypothetical protein A3863_04765 [Priestia endophytica]
MKNLRNTTTSISCCVKEDEQKKDNKEKGHLISKVKNLSGIRMVSEILRGWIIKKGKIFMGYAFHSISQIELIYLYL